MTGPIDLGLHGSLQALAMVNALYVTNDITRDDCLIRASKVVPIEWLWVVAWSLEGQSTGHVWCVCDACGEARLMRPRRHKCVSGPTGTYRVKRALCEGSMHPVAKPPRRTATLKRLLEDK